MEPAEGCSFVAAAFDVVLDDAQREAFCARETGYAIVEAPFHGLDAGEEVLDGPTKPLSLPLAACPSSTYLFITKSRYHHFSLSIALGQHKSPPCAGAAGRARRGAGRHGARGADIALGRGRRRAARGTRELRRGALAAGRLALEVDEVEVVHSGAARGYFEGNKEVRTVIVCESHGSGGGARWI